MSAAICLPDKPDARGLLRASVRRVPLAGQSQTVCVPEGASLARLVAEAFPDAFLRRFVVAFVGGVEIAADAWDAFTPAAGDFINLCIRPGDGDSGVGKVLRTVLQIAVIAAAAWVGTMVGGIPGMFASAAVSMAGNLLINTLIPLNPLKAQGETPAPFYTVTGARNQARVYSPVSFVLGKHRLFPPLYGRFVQETVGNDVYLRVPFCLGPAPVQISELKIGDTPLDSFDGVEIEQRLTADAPDHTLYTGDPDQEAVGAQLTTTYTARNTALDVDEIEVVLGFRGGLGGYDSKQRKVSKGVGFEIRYRPAGTSDAWQTHRPSVPQANEASAAAGVPFRPHYFLSLPNLTEYIGELNALGGVPSGPVVVTRADPGRGFQHVVRFAVPRHPDGYAVEVRRTTAESTDPNTVDAVWWEILGSTKSFVDPFPEKGLASLVLRIKASAQLSGVIDSFNAVVEPIVPLFSSASKAAPESASAASLTTTGVSRNHAEIVLNLYRGSQAARPRPDERIDWPAWAAFAAFCDANSLHYDEVIDTTIARGELARRICASAFARPIRWGGKLSVVIDRDRTGEAPAQVFTPRNVANLQWRKTFPLDVHAVRIAFNNAENGYQADEVTLYLDGYDASNATKFETLAVSGKTDPDEVRRVGRQFINNSLRQTESFTFDMDAEALTCRPGAYAVLLHDAIGVGLGAARVKSLETSGGNVTAFVLDFGIATEAADTHAARWRKSDGEGGFEVASDAAVTRDAANPARFVFGSPQPVATAPAVDEVVLIGIAEEVALPVLVRDVAPDFNHRASVTVIPYAGERFTPDGSPLPPHEPMVQLPIAARPATPVELSTTANAREIALSFFQGASPRGVTLTGFETAVREHGNTADSWQDRGPLPADARVFVAPPGNPGYSYDLRVVAVGNDSGGLPVRSDPLIVEDVAAAISPAAPAGCSAAFETRTSAGGASQLVLVATWTPVEDPDVLDTRVEMRTATGPDVYAEIGQGRAANGRTEIHGLQVGRAYVLGFVHLSRRGIASTRTVIASITAPDTLVATAAHTAAPGSPLEADFEAALAAAAAAAASASAAAAAEIEAEAAEATAIAQAAIATAQAGAATTSASAAAGSASSASTSAGAASTSAGNAAASATTAGNHATTASGHASTATTQAAAATAAAAAAQASAVLSASIGGGALNRNPSFSDYTSTSGVPGSWVDWISGSLFTRQGGEVAGWSADIDMPNAGDYGIQQGGIYSAPGYYVLEADAWLQSGTWNGAGVLFWGAGEANDQIDFGVDKDINNATGASGPGIRRFRKLIYCATAETKIIYAIANWSGMASASTQKRIRFYRVSVRAASQAEIEAREATTAIPTINASIATNAAAIATLNGSLASLTTTVSANFTTLDNKTNANPNLMPYPSGNARSGESFAASSLGWQTYAAAGSPLFNQIYYSPRGGQEYYLEWASGFTSAGVQVFYFDIPVSDGGAYTLSLNGQDYNCAAYIYLQCLDATRTVDTTTAALAVDFPASMARIKTTSTGNGSTRWLRVQIALAAQTVVGYAALAFNQIKVERGGIATVFSDDARMAEANASIVTNASAIAAANASIASLTTTVTANFRNATSSLLLQNSKFQDVLVGGIPVGWGNWSGPGGSLVSRIGSTGNAFRAVGGAGAANGIVQITPHASVSQGPYLLRATIRRTGGSLDGAGLYVEFYGPTDSYLGNAQIYFAAEAMLNGATTSVPDGVVSWEKQIVAPSGTSKVALYAMTHWQGGNFGSVAVANQIDWHEVDLVPIGNAQVRLAVAEASIATNTAAIASANSSIAALSTTVTANFTALRSGGDSVALPSSFERDDLYWQKDNGGTFVYVANIGRVFQAIDVAHYVRSRGLLQLRPGRTYRLTARYRVETNSSNGYNPQPLAGLTLWNETGLNVAGIWVGSFVSRTVADGWVTVTGDYSTSTILGVNAGATQIDAYCQPNWHPSNNPNAVTQVQFVKLEDVTDIVTVTAQITEVRTAVTDAGGGYAYWGMKLDGGGRFASMEALASSKTNISEFRFTADKFKVYNGSTDEAPFVVEGGVVKAKKVQAAELSAITANIGTLRTASTGARMELRDNVLVCYDASGVDVVKLGNLAL